MKNTTDPGKVMKYFNDKNAERASKFQSGGPMDGPGAGQPLAEPNANPMTSGVPSSMGAQPMMMPPTPVVSRPIKHVKHKRKK